MSVFINSLRALPDAAPPLSKPFDTLLRVALLSDTHITAEQYRLLFFRPAMKKLHLFLPELLLFAGDCTDTGNEKNWRAFTDAVNTCGVDDKLIAVGNHDLWTSYDTPHDYVSAKENYLRFSNELMRTDHETVYFRYMKNGFPFLVLGSEDTSVCSEIGEMQLEWLRAALALADEMRGHKPIFVVNHSPMNHTHGVGENEHGMGIGGDMSKKLQALLDGYKNIVYICGHVHFGLQTGGRTPTVQKVGEHITSICLPSYEYGELFNGKYATPGYPLLGAGLLMDVKADQLLLHGCNYLRGKMIPGFEAQIPLR